jgi:cullin-associated NEDD8-dissociated protein 1
MHTLLESSLSRIDVFEFLGNVITGLNDESQEIKILCYLMTQKLAQSSPAAVGHKLDDFIPSLKKTLEMKFKDTAVKQELERGKELVRAAAKTTLVLSQICQDQQCAFPNFVQEMKGPNSTVSSVFQEMEQELQGTDLTRSRTFDMMEM